MRNLTNPPEEYAEAYVALQNLYDSYTDFIGLVVDLSGSYADYASNFNDADNAFLTNYQKVRLYIKD